MDHEVSVEEYFGGPVYALIIGISIYEDYCENDETVNKSCFPNLKFARKDAENFRTYLEERGVSKNAILELTDAKATYRSINIAFQKLSDFCRNAVPANPLVIIFYSGHGESAVASASGDVENYLIPYDVNKDYISSTAFSNTHFNDRLNNLKTDKLVVFLDACHSGGSTGDGAKGAENKFEIKPGEGAGRYFIASCSRGELSYEGEQNGIFTQHLLQLLTCDGPDDDIITDEVINPNNLFEKLREKVATTARTKGKNQNPTRKIVGEERPIILGINWKVRERKLRDEEKTKAERRAEDQNKKQNDFFKKLSEHIEKNLEFKNKDRLGVLLSDYLGPEKSIIPRFQILYNLFDQYFDEWSTAPEQVTVEDEAAFLLIKRFNAILKSVPPLGILNKELAAQSAISASTKPGTLEKNEKNSDAQVESPAAMQITDTSTAYKNSQPAINASVSANMNQAANSLPGSVRAMRKMNDYADYILEPIKQVKLYDEFLDLTDLLAKPAISEAQFIDAQSKIRTSAKWDNETETEKKEIMENLRMVAKRFGECWQKAEPVKILSTSDLLLKR